MGECGKVVRKLSCRDALSLSKLEGKYKGEPIVIMGNSSSLLTHDLSSLARIITIGCNRAMRHASFVPDYLMISDREPYSQELEAGRLRLAYDKGVKILLSDTIFDSKVRCVRLGGDKERELQAMPYLDFKWYHWRVSQGAAPINFHSFSYELASFANIAGPMLQAAVIMGASVVGCVGIDMAWPKDTQSHFFGSGADVGAYPFSALERTMANFITAKQKLKALGIPVYNLSPVKGTPFAQCFGTSSFSDFGRIFCK